MNIFVMLKGPKPRGQKFQVIHSKKKVADLLNPQEQTYHLINIDTVEGDQLAFHGEESLDTRIL